MTYPDLHTTLFRRSNNVIVTSERYIDVERLKDVMCLTTSERFISTLKQRFKYINKHETYNNAYMIPITSSRIFLLTKLTLCNSSKF